MKKVLDVGNCGPDFSSIRSFLTRNFDCEVHQAHGPDDALTALGESEYALVLINRKLDRDYSDGIEILRAIKSNPKLQQTPVMLVTNYPDHQDAAVEMGAERGFGKLELGDPATRERVAAILEG